MAVNYRFGGNSEFIIEGYDKAKTFAGFLPGIAGLDGIPMWAFYVNRGQALGSFGVRDKNSPIMEFLPATTMYRNIERQGFRTFIRKDGSVHELFSSTSGDDADRMMSIEKNVVSVAEVNRALNLKVTVTYFALPGESFAAIVRKVTVESIDGGETEFELLDGLPLILPAGVTNGDWQAMANLVRAWFDVHNLENNIPFYKLRGSLGDTVEVTEITSGNFFLSFSSQSQGLIPPIYDMDVIFGANTALSRPEGWDCPVEELARRRQVPTNKASGGFAGVRVALRDSFTLCTVIGHAQSLDSINSRRGSFTVEYIESKLAEARGLTERLVDNTRTATALPLFDQYISQCNLDNVMRGGYPLLFPAGDRQHVYHVYSRKHGDMEREYNLFSLEPGFYSQGNGNFRDVNQNRRNDVLLNPAVGSFNVRHFMSLIQADGYNPLQVKGCTFTLDGAAWPELRGLALSHHDGLEALLKGSFTPGRLLAFLSSNGVKLTLPAGDFLRQALEHSAQNLEAEFSEGYWSDHWTYNMDLVDTYLAVYPDCKERFLFDEGGYRFFHSPVFVLPRADKYVLTDGKVRQYGALHHGKDGIRETRWLKTEAGETYETNLFAKLLCLALVKFTTLDPAGMGIEMEANRPGWNDALNGLPGLFGSGLGEAAELMRIVDFLIGTCAEFDRKIPIFAEAGGLLAETERLLERNLAGALGDFEYWDRVSGLREGYREAVQQGIEGREAGLRTKDLLPTLIMMAKKLEKGLEKALQLGQGIYPTYFTYEAVRWEPIEGKTSPEGGHQNVRVLKFVAQPLPHFLEGPARMLKTMGNGRAVALYDAVKASALYDRKLKMYKTSGPLTGASHEIGRLWAFTPGWLEREAVFLHMEYKYLYAMLKAGLPAQCFEDMKTALIPLLKPEIYGRSTLENSSFLASSANPDEAVHGRGFVARLSGSTAEMLSIWFTMMTGGQPFHVESGALMLKFAPILPGWLFDGEGRVSFTFLGRTRVTYHNAGWRDTFGPDGVKPRRIVLHTADGAVEIDGDTICTPYARAIRAGDVPEIEVWLA